MLVELDALGSVGCRAIGEDEPDFFDPDFIIYANEWVRARESLRAWATDSERRLEFADADGHAENIFDICVPPVQFFFQTALLWHAFGMGADQVEAPSAGVLVPVIVSGLNANRRSPDAKR